MEEQQQQQQQQQERVRRYLEEQRNKEEPRKNKLMEEMVMKGLRIDLVQPSRLLCSFKVPHYLLNSGNNRCLHGGAIATLVDVISSAVIYTHEGATNVGVSVEINVSYLDAAYLHEEIDIEAKSLRVGKAVAVISVELRKKKTGKIVAHGRHTKYLPVSSKL